MPLGQYDWNGPEVTELRKLAPQAFVHFYGGYRLRAIYYEVFEDVVADYLRAEATGCSTTSRRARAPASSAPRAGRACCA